MPSVSLKEINRLAVPAILAGISEPLISLADTAIIGHLGSDALGGVGVATSLFTFLFWTVGQTRTAISSLVSQYLGKNQLPKVRTLVPQAILVNMLLGALVLLGTLPFCTQIFSGFYKAGPELLEPATAYYEIRALGFPIILGVFAIYGVFRGMQNTLWAMQISLIGSVVNLLLDILLVYGIDGVVPSFGVQGAAIASVASQALMLVLSVIYLLRKYPHVVSVSFSPNPELRNLLGMTGNLVLRTIALNIAFILATRYATGYGTEYIAAHTIALQIWLFSAFFIDGYANAGNALGGRLIGAGDFAELYRVGFAITRISVLIGVLLGLVYALGYFFTGELFTDDAKVIAQFEAIYWFVIIMQPINAIAFSLDGLFKGMGQTKLLRNVLFAATFLGFIPVLMLADRADWLLYSVWCAFLVWMLVRSAILAVVFYTSYGPPSRAD